ncbi:MAG: trypsin-like peptidase domain-containing protein [Bacteroidales bacterium]|nr:trypsin-like peptidase domain-containing protein [Bacteroidales bacterium]
MKKLFVVFFLTSFLTGLSAQSITKNPQVDKSYKSEWGSPTITDVIISEENTFIVLEDITSRYLSGGWISMSSKTTITAKNSNLVLKIQEWGYYDDWREEYQPLVFNKKYSVEKDRRYLFVLVFPSIPTGIENITIRENEQHEFFWEGIHINNSSQTHSKSSSSSFSSFFSDKKKGSDKFELAGSGTCFAINENGYIATAYHVIESVSRIRIRGIDGDFDKTYQAKVVASDKKNDLAILKIDDNNFSGRFSGKIPYGFSNQIKEVGDEIIVLGYPLRAVMGDEIKLTNGLISSRTGFQGDVTTYQISAAVQPGNSGGPLLDSKGNLIGIISSRLYIESAAYAIKIPYLLTLASSLQEDIVLSQSTALQGKSLSEQVKEIKQFIYIIEIEE